MGLSSASLIVWHLSSSPKLKYRLEHHTDVYRPLSDRSIPITDRDYRTLPIFVIDQVTDMPSLPPPVLNRGVAMAPWGGGGGAEGQQQAMRKMPLLRIVRTGVGWSASARGGAPVKDGYGVVYAGGPLCGPRPVSVTRERPLTQWCGASGQPGRLVVACGLG